MELAGLGRSLPSETDRDARLRWRTAAQQGHPAAQYLLGLCLEEGADDEPDPAQAFRCYQSSAEQGHPLGQYGVGRCLVEGIGVAQDKALGTAWYREAANQGFSLAQCAYGLCLMEGNGAPSDPAAGLRWLREAASMGHAIAQAHVAACFEFGDGVAQDKAQAFAWYARAAEQGLAHGQYCLAACYEEGLGTVRDEAQARGWYLRAAEQGHTDAQYEYAMRCQRDGEVQQALHWLQRAATSEHAQAVHALGLACARGEGCEQDLKQAVTHFERSLALGYEPARRGLSRASAELAADPLEVILDCVKQGDEKGAREAAGQLTGASLPGPSVRQIVLERLLPLADCTPPATAAILALLAGIFAEAGSDARALASVLVKRLPANLCRALVFQEEVQRCWQAVQGPLDQQLGVQLAEPPPQLLAAVADRLPEEAACWGASDGLVRGAVAMLCRHREVRRAAALDAELRSALESAMAWHASSRYLQRLLAAPDQEPLLVVEPAGGRAWVTRIDGVSDNRQLLALLQHALCRDLGMPELTAEVLAVLQGSGPRRCASEVVAHWALCQWTAAGTRQPGPEHRLAPEAGPAEIDLFEGTRALLLLAPQRSVRWPAARIFSGLTASVERLRALHTDEANVLLARMIAAKGA